MELTGSTHKIETISISPRDVIEMLKKEYFLSISLPKDAFIYGSHWCEDLSPHCNNNQIRRYTVEEIKMWESLNTIINHFRDDE